jgi:hypothetical protein
MNQKRQDNLRQRIRRMQARDVISEADIFLRCGGADLWVDHLIELLPSGNDCIREHMASYWRTMEGECVESGEYLAEEVDASDTRIGIGGNLHALTTKSPVPHPTRHCRPRWRRHAGWGTAMRSYTAGTI